MKMMEKRIDGLQVAVVNTASQPSNGWSQSEEALEKCNYEQQPEQVQYMHNTSSSSQNDFHGDTYNPSWNNHPNLRSGKTLNNGKGDSEVAIEEKDQEKLKKKEEESQAPRKGKQVMEEHPQEQRKEVKPYIPPLPYPQRLQRELKDQQFLKFLEVFKKLEINLLLAEASEKMPLYAKFLKELINKKRSWNEKEIVVLTQECSAVIQKGASINLMPLSLIKKLAIEEVKPTRMSLQMADRSLKIPNGVVENLLVKVGEFIFPADFVILDMEEEGHNSIILSRPFLATTRAIIDVKKGEMILRVDNEQMIINAFKVMQHPPKKEKHMRVKMIEELEEELLEANGQEEQEEEIEIEQDVSEEQVTEVSSEDKTEEVSKQELKPLPPHLKYAYLGEGDSLPVIINSSLSMEDETKLIEVLKNHKTTLGWTIDGIKGISPAILRDRKGSENQVADHLSRLPQETNQDVHQPVNEKFPDEYLLQVQQAPWFADIANYKVGRKIPQEFTRQQLKKLLKEAKKFLWDEPFLFNRCSDGMIRRCVPENEMRDILWHCHGSAYGGHFGPERLAAKVLQSGFYWPTIFRDAREFVHQ
ncbi:uncharacterized protein [Arachis hypogaea]|uniref:uncharacterized protein n=1 Tax=Arachis hypogaea TaxID=3818 RepID=UPI003B21296E